MSHEDNFGEYMDEVAPHDITAADRKLIKDQETPETEKKEKPLRTLHSMAAENQKLKAKAEKDRAEAEKTREELKKVA